MSGRIVSLFASPHRRALELMPWYAAGSLAADEQAEVEQHLAGCSACQRELQWQRDLQAAYAKSAVQPDMERALARLRPRLAGTAGARAGGEAGARPGWRDHLRGLAAAAPGWVRIALAVQLGIIVTLGWAVAGRDRGDGYRLLGSTADGRAATMLIVFDPNVHERDVQRLLRAASARIVDGPTAGNGYLIRTAPGGRASALATLRGAPAVVLAEPLDASSE